MPRATTVALGALATGGALLALGWLYITMASATESDALVRNEVWRIDHDQPAMVGEVFEVSQFGRRVTPLCEPANWRDAVTPKAVTAYYRNTLGETVAAEFLFSIALGRLKAGEGDDRTGPGFSADAAPGAGGVGVNSESFEGVFTMPSYAKVSLKGQLMRHGVLDRTAPGRRYVPDLEDCLRKMATVIAEGRRVCQVARTWHVAAIKDAFENGRYVGDKLPSTHYAFFREPIFVPDAVFAAHGVERGMLSRILSVVDPRGCPGNQRWAVHLRSWLDLIQPVEPETQDIGATAGSTI